MDQRECVGGLCVVAVNDDERRDGVDKGDPPELFWLNIRVVAPEITLQEHEDPRLFSEPPQKAK